MEKTLKKRTREKKPTPTGSEIEETWAMKLGKNGEEEFYIKGKTNVFEKIQSYKEETEIEKILTRYAETGDTTLLNVKTPQYLDTTNFPENYIEMFNTIQKGKEYFNKLSEKEKEIFDNNFDNFLTGTIKELEKVTEEKEKEKEINE